VDPDPDTDPHHFGNLDPHLHQIKIRIRIKIYKLDPEPDPDPHQFLYVKPNCMKYEPTMALFQGFEPFFLKLGSGSGFASGRKVETHPVPHQGDKSNPDP
jgi:hypothetical protein